MLCWLDRWKVACATAPKAMSTTLGRAFYELAEGRRYDRAQHDGRTIHLFWRNRVEAMGSPECPPPLDRFAGFQLVAVVRDPVRRLLSAYQDRVVTKGELVHSFARRARRPDGRAQLAGLDPRPDPDRFFADLPRYVSLSTTLQHHMAPFATFLGDDLSRYHRVFRTEDSPAIGEWLSQVLGRAVVLGREQRSRSGQLRLDDLGPRARRMIARHVAADFRLLHEHYRPDPMLGPGAADDDLGERPARRA